MPAGLSKRVAPRRRNDRRPSRRSPGVIDTRRRAPPIGKALPDPEGVRQGKRTEMPASGILIVRVPRLSAKGT